MKHFTPTLILPHKGGGNISSRTKKKNYVIIGLGLIGGSLAAAISHYIRGARIIAVSRDPKKISFAKKKKWIHEGTSNLESAVRFADYIFVCAPVDTIPNLISAIDRHAKVGAIVTDVGSTKSEIINSIKRKKLKRIQFVGSHPLAGSHLTGVQHATPNLFDGAFVFVAPSQGTSQQAVHAIASVWKQLKTQVIVISPEAHDQIVSQISHLPHAAAALLMQTVSPKALHFAASGFLDTTRVAQGDPNLWTPIFLTNKINLVKDLKQLSKSLMNLIRLIGQGNPKKLSRFLKTASIKRSKLAS